MTASTLAPVMSFGQLVADVAAHSSSPDPHVLTAEVMRRIPPGMPKDWFQQAVYQYVRQTVVRLVPVASQPSPATGSTQPARKPAVGQPRFRRHDTLMGKRFSFEGGWKALEDSTIDDIRWAAQVRYKHAAESQAAADNFTKLGDYMDQHGIILTRDVPPAVVEAYLG